MEKRAHIILFFSGLLSGLLIASGVMYHYIGKAEREGYNEGYERGKASVIQKAATGSAVLPSAVATNTPTEAIQPIAEQGEG